MLGKKKALGLPGMMGSELYHLLDHQLPKDHLALLQKESPGFTPQGWEAQCHTPKGMADGWTNLGYLWQQRINNSHPQNDRGKRKLAFLQQEKRQAEIEGSQPRVQYFYS